MNDFWTDSEGFARTPEGGFIFDAATRRLVDFTQAFSSLLKEHQVRFVPGTWTMPIEADGVPAHVIVARGNIVSFETPPGDDSAEPEL